MSNLTNISSVNVPKEIEELKPSEEFLKALKELDYMESHPEEYESYSNIEDLKKALLSDE